MADDKSLPQAGPESLGLPTMMDRSLAARHGVPYVHLAAFAIDVDRIREHREGPDDPRPFGWEVFIVEAYLVEHFDPNRRPEQVLFFEDIVLSVLDGEPGALGSQIAFAIWDLIRRGRFPQRLRGAFEPWKGRPTELARDLDRLFAEEATQIAEIARGCVDIALDPPIAPPTKEALHAMLS